MSAGAPVDYETRVRRCVEAVARVIAEEAGQRVAQFPPNPLRLNLEMQVGASMLRHAAEMQGRSPVALAISVLSGQNAYVEIEPEQ